MMILISETDVKIAEEVEVPKVLGDIFESIAGAIYLDSGNDLKAVWRTYYNIMKEEISKILPNLYFMRLFRNKILIKCFFL